MKKSTEESFEILSQPFTLANGTTILNRLAKSAMSESLATIDHQPTPELDRLYARWADGGIGLCITGNVMIDPAALGEPNNVVVEDDSSLDALKRWARAGTRGGTQLWMQINHPGKQAPRGLNRETVAPSAVPFKPDMARFFDTPRELTNTEIENIILRFANTAALAQKAGFSGVQIHGAHGYLVSQFLSPHHNRRTDEWGGSPEKRRRFVLKTLAAIRERVGPAFSIGIKLNSADFQRGGFTEEESLETIAELAKASIDLVEISGGNYESPVMSGKGRQKESSLKREAYFIEFTEKVRAHSKVPLLLTGGFRSVHGMTEALSSGAVDFVGMARLLAIEPELPRRLLQGLDPIHGVHPIRTGIGPIDKMALMEITWYSRQLHRIGKGLVPKPNESALASLALSLISGGWRTFKTRRLRASSSSN